jgi:hypothetical protein
MLRLVGRVAAETSTRSFATTYTYQSLSTAV